MSLQDEIDRARADIRTDGYSVSIGEWMSLYESSELDVHPEFQRAYRWSPKQKSRLIESILLGIPIPPVFVAQRPDGVWDVIDGVQRLSTIYELAGILKDEAGELLAPLILESTHYLPSLGSCQWNGGNDGNLSLDSAQKLIIKRSKIDVSIVLRESDDSTKYELFQRLNTGGSRLSNQEVRNSMLVMMNPVFFEWLSALSDNQHFKECISISDRNLSEQYDKELVVRFLVFRSIQQEKLVGLGDMGDFLTDQISEIAKNPDYDYQIEKAAFEKTFEILANSLGGESFRRFDIDRQKFVQAFSVSAYEVISLGIGFNQHHVAGGEIDILEKVKGLWQNDYFVSNSGSGVRASHRIPKLLPFARELFSG